MPHLKTKSLKTSLASNHAKKKGAVKKSAVVLRVDSNGITFDRIIAQYRKYRGSRNALKECLKLIEGRGLADTHKLLNTLPPAWSDYAIASIYTLLMPSKKRKRLGAYFTPPYLVDHLVNRMKECGLDPINHRLSDPAAGGAAFLVPLARLKVTEWRKKGLTDKQIICDLSKQLVGREIEQGLATLANALLRRMLLDEFGISSALLKKLKLIQIGNSLTTSEGIIGKIDHEVGNPPFLRLPHHQQKAIQKRFIDIASGRLNLYAMFIRRALDEVPIDGLVGYIVPSSFLGGPEFSAFRRRIQQLSEVLIIDVIEKRSDVFLEATQDTCFIVLKRRQSTIEEPGASTAKSGILRSNGAFVNLGVSKIEPNGLPWQLPGVEQDNTKTLIELGYRGIIGYLVANRQSERLYKRYAKQRFPLIWAKSITPEGLFDFERGAAFKGLGWVQAPVEASYIIRQACVAVQRTSARGQKRRISAAAISQEFIDKHEGVVGENHVILLVPTREDAVPPETLAKALNTLEASAELDRVCGSASISVRILENIPLSIS